MKTILIGALIVGAVAVGAEQLRITVYNKAGILDQEKESVVVSLSRIFRHAGIEIDWVAGVPRAPESSLMIYEPLRKGNELEMACRARRDIALDILPFGTSKQILGMAQPFARTGLNVRIYGYGVRDAAARELRPYATVLSHAIAHEIGHVLLRSNSHTGRGLMSAVWTAREYDWMGKEALFFTPEDSRKMRFALSGVACSSFD